MRKFRAKHNPIYKFWQIEEFRKDGFGGEELQWLPPFSTSSGYGLNGGFALEELILPHLLNNVSDDFIYNNKTSDEWRQELLDKATLAAMVTEEEKEKMLGFLLR